LASSGSIIDEKVEKLLGGGRDLILAGKLDEAMNQLTEVLLHDKKNKRALHCLDRIWAARRNQIPLPQDGGPPLDEELEQLLPEPAGDPVIDPASSEPAREAGAEGAGAEADVAGAGSDPDSDPAPVLPEEAILGPVDEPAAAGEPELLIDHSNLPPVVEEGSMASEPADSSAAGEGSSGFVPLDMHCVLIRDVLEDEIHNLSLDPIADYALRVVNGELTIGQVADKCLLDTDSAVSLFQDLNFRGVVKVKL